MELGTGFGAEALVAALDGSPGDTLVAGASGRPDGIGGGGGP